MSRPIIYLGGSFDPVHRGHLESANELAIKLDAKETYLLPAKLSPLKSSTLASNTQRLDMLSLAIENYPLLQLDTREIDRESASYTLLTLQELRQELGSQQSLVFAMGMDSFIEIQRWFHWSELTNYAHLAVFSRPGYETNVTPELAKWLGSHRVLGSNKLKQSPCGHIWLTELAPFSISSTHLRQLCHQPERASLNQWMPETVVDYILKYHPYI